MPPSQRRPRAKVGRRDSIWPVVLIFVAVIVIAVVLLRFRQTSQLITAQRDVRVGCSQVAPAFRAHRSGAWLSLSARVTRLLPDANGARVHQRFVVACTGGQTVLIVNDISIGERVPVVTGDQVTVRGQYIWNAEGGLVHFTHHVVGSTESGWILFQGRLYSLGRSPLF